MEEYHHGGVMVSVLALSAEGRGSDPRPCQIKGITIGICCFSAKQATLRRKSKDGLDCSQNNMSGLSGPFSCGAVAFIAR